MLKFVIIMPAYNAEKDIRRAIDSVLQQTYTDFLLVVVNDGSTDRTADILNEYKEEPRIHILHQENKGIAQAYQHAFKYLDGNYVMFLDSDDSWECHTLEDVNNTIAETEADVVQFGIAYYDERWQYKGELTFEDGNIKGNEAIMQHYFSGLTDGTNRPNLGIRAYRREILENYVFSGNASLGIDEILNLYGLCSCESLVFLPKTYYQCQQRTNSVSRKKATTEKILGILSCYDEMNRIISECCPAFLDYLYVKYIRLFISYSNILKNEDGYADYRKRAKMYLSVVRGSKRNYLSINHTLRCFMFIYCAGVLNFILNKK